MNLNSGIPVPGMHRIVSTGSTRIQNCTTIQSMKDYNIFIILVQEDSI